LIFFEKAQGLPKLLNRAKKNGDLFMNITLGIFESAVRFCFKRSIFRLVISREKGHMSPP
jgi:hypothetical protein